MVMMIMYLLLLLHQTRRHRRVPQLKKRDEKSTVVVAVRGSVLLNFWERRIPLTFNLPTTTVLMVFLLLSKAPTWHNKGNLRESTDYMASSRSPT
jgi:uncharacterized membrane protein